MQTLDFDGPEPSSPGSRARGLRGHHRLADNDERTVLGLVKDAGLAGVMKAEQRVVLGFVRLAYYARVNRRVVVKSDFRRSLSARWRRSGKRTSRT